MKTKLLCLFASILFISAATPMDLGTATSHTPYDAYLQPLWTVFRHLGNGQPDPAEVERLVGEARSFRYVFKNDQSYVPQAPEVTESTKSGDCKAKSLWLIAKMSTRKVRYVIGKAQLGSRNCHAWVIWQGPKGWLILDATNSSRPLVPHSLFPTEYIPTYSYSPSGRYVHNIAAAHRLGKIVSGCHTRKCSGRGEGHGRRRVPKSADHP